jgi:DNA-binding MarR family transcriptional regulator
MADDIDPRLEAYRLLIADIAELMGHSRRTSDRMAREVGQTSARWHLMSVLSDGPRTVAAAARRLGLARQSVQRVANDLVDERLAIAETNPDDARAPLIELTPTGHDLCAQLYARSDAARTRLVTDAQVTAADLNTARSTIRALIEYIDVGHTDHADE